MQPSGRTQRIMTHTDHYCGDKWRVQCCYLDRAEAAAGRTAPAQRASRRAAALRLQASSCCQAASGCSVSSQCSARSPSSSALHIALCSAAAAGCALCHTSPTACFIKNTNMREFPFPSGEAPTCCCACMSALHLRGAGSQPRNVLHPGDAHHANRLQLSRASPRVPATDLRCQRGIGRRADGGADARLPVQKVLQGGPWQGRLECLHGLQQHRTLHPRLGCYARFACEQYTTVVSNSSYTAARYSGCSCIGSQNQQNDVYI